CRPAARQLPAPRLPPAGERRGSQAVRRPGGRAARGGGLLRDGNALGLPGRPLLARFPLPRRAGRQARRPRPGLPAVVLLLAVDYGTPGVSGSQIRRVPLPADSPRGGFLTQAAILKITANGTTTSPVPRGAFVMDRILGQPPEPPPANVAAIEPDVRGVKTIR